MTIDIAVLFAVLLVMTFLFMTEKLPVDLTAFLGLSALIALGYVTPVEAFQGFSSPAVITMMAIFIVSAGLRQSGVADAVGHRIHQWVGAEEVPLMITIMIICAVLSAFMNNVAATAVLLPAIASVARRGGIPPSRLFIPLAFGSILGGTSTLVGTPPNLLASLALSQRGLEPFELFDFAPFGVALLLAGVLFMATVGRRLLPAHREHDPSDPRGDLTQVYRIRERLFSIRIPDRSPLAGMTLRDAQLSDALGVQVIQILRRGRKQLAPGNDAVMEAGDVLVVGGRFEELKERLRMRGVVVDEEPPDELGEVSGYYDLVLVRLRDKSPFVGQTIAGTRFRERFGVVPAGVWRNGDVLRERLDHLRLNDGDEVLLVGVQSAIDTVADHPDFEVVALGAAARDRLRQSLFLVRVPEGSPLAAEPITPRRVEELISSTVVAVVRDDETVWASSPDEPLKEGDRLLISGAPARILSMMQVGELEIDPDASPSELESDEVRFVEAVVAPRSELAGKTLAELDFRERYGMQVLAIWREGHPIRSGFAHSRIRFGDALLMQGPRERARQLRTDRDFVVLRGDDVDEAPRTTKAPFAIGGLLLMIALVVMRVFPIQVAAFLAAVAILTCRVLTMEEAYRAIEWRAIFLVAAVLPVGDAMETCGAAMLVAQSVTDVAGSFGPYVVLGALVLLSSLLSQCLDGSPTVVLLAPVILHTATALEISPYPLMMGVGLAASAAFMTPFSHKSNLLVMSAGGYRVMDYVRVGTPLTVVVLAIITAMVPMFFPFDVPAP